MQSKEYWRSRKDLILCTQGTCAMVAVSVLAVISKGLGITPLSSLNSMKGGVQKARILFASEWGKKTAV